VGPGRHINEARAALAALARGDVPGAQRGIGQALAATRWTDGRAAAGAEVIAGPGARGGGAGLR
jgi:hypothetical protein